MKLLKDVGSPDTCQLAPPSVVRTTVECVSPQPVDAFTMSIEVIWDTDTGPMLPVADGDRDGEDPGSGPAVEAAFEPWWTLQAETASIRLDIKRSAVNRDRDNIVHALLLR